MKKNNWFKQITASLLGFALIGPLSTTLAAQDFNGALPADGLGLAAGADMPSKEKLGGAKQYQLQTQYAIEIRRIDAAAKLDDAQKKKLTIGAKGLAKKQAQEYVASFYMMMGEAMPVNGAQPIAMPKDNEPEAKLVEVKSFADIDATTMSMLDNGLAPQAKPYEDAQWLKLVKSVLKPEQYSKVEQATAAYKLSADKAMVDAGVAALSVDLVLSDEQATKLAALILENVTKAHEGPSDDDPAGMAIPMMIGADGMQFNMELAKMDSKLLKGLLDPQQLELLEFKLANYRFMAGAIGMGIAVPFNGQ